MTEEKTESPAQEEGTEDFAAMLAAHSASSGRLQPGQKVSGTVIAITGDSVFVDVGIKVDGIMPRARKARGPATAWKLGSLLFLRRKSAFPAP